MLLPSLPPAARGCCSPWWWCAGSASSSTSASSASWPSAGARNGMSLSLSSSSTAMLAAATGSVVCVCSWRTATRHALNALSRWPYVARAHHATVSARCRWATNGRRLGAGPLGTCASTRTHDHERPQESLRKSAYVLQHALLLSSLLRLSRIPEDALLPCCPWTASLSLPLYLCMRFIQLSLIRSLSSSYNSLSSLILQHTLFLCISLPPSPSLSFPLPLSLSLASSSSSD